MIKRSDGSIHSAYLTSIDLKSKSLIVEWADEESVKKRVKNIKLGSTFKSLNPEISFEEEEEQIINHEEKTKVTMVELTEVKDAENVVPEKHMTQSEGRKSLENNGEIRDKSVDDISRSVDDIDIIDSEI